MISFKKIGYFGRLGNQMFQFAATYGIANKLGYEVAFPIENVKNMGTETLVDGSVQKVNFDIPNVFKLQEGILKPVEEIKNIIEAHEKTFCFTEDFFRIKDETNLQGFFQTEKYFEHCREDIKRLYTFKDDIVEESKDKFPKLKTETVSIHLRFGDYIAMQQLHPICDSEYYTSALEHFKDKPYHFLIFSDNIAYCKQIFGESENISYIEGNSAFVDMCMMSMCDHNIIANSSFSWWSAWLNQNSNKKIIAPKNWFGPGYAYHDTKDLYCKNWIVT